MRIFAYLIALGLFTGATAANATFTFDLSSVTVIGTETVSVYQTGCGVIGLCSIATNPSSSFIGGPLSGTANALDGIITLTGYHPGSRVGGTITLTFSGGSFLSSSFSGTSFLLNGSCPSNCNVRDGVYSAANFSVGVFDSTTRLYSILQPVPEPSTWAMMLIGFGAIGLAMRRRKKSQSGMLARL